LHPPPPYSAIEFFIPVPNAERMNVIVNRHSLVIFTGYMHPQLCLLCLELAFRAGLQGRMLLSQCLLS
jgi:hypothetical protein